MQIRPVSAKIVGYQESREIAYKRNAAGEIIDSFPVEGSEKAFLDLKLPTGKVVRAEVPHARFLVDVAPLLARA